MPHRLASMEDASLRAMIAANADAMLVIDARGDVLFASPAAEQLFGVPATALVGSQFGLPVAPGTTAEIRLPREGGVGIGEMRVAEIEWSGRRAYLASVRDVTERHETLAALASATNQLQAILAASPVAVVVLDDRGLVRTWNPGAARIFGWTEEQVLGKAMPIQIADEESADLWARVAGGEQLEGVELRCATRSGLPIEVSLASAPLPVSGGARTAGVAVLADITERRRQEDEIRHLAAHDPLTGLPNRRAMEANLERMIGAAERGEPAALLMLDLDRFKEVNDEAGHLVGDELLRQVAERLHEPLRPGDLVARLGGDEFAVLAPGVTEEEAYEIGERLVEAIRTFRFSHGERVYDVRLSVGAASIDAGLTPEEVLATADAALYMAKEAGRDQVVMLARPPGERTPEQPARHWAERITSAIREHRFVVHFQPVVHLDTRRVEYFEALPRIREGERLVLPGAFVPEAERAGLIEQIDRIVVAEVVATLSRDARTPVFVNVSSETVQEATIIDHAAGALERSGVAPDRLGFEITERDLNADMGRGGPFVERLASLGCRLAVDDFGASFPSFSYLGPLPADYVKIDGSFVRAVRSDPQSRAIVESITAVAHAHHKQVVAECIESPEIDAAIAELGVEFGQGTRFARPGARKAGAGPG